jgi:hypothetical protein
MGGHWNTASLQTSREKYYNATAPAVRKNLLNIVQALETELSASRVKLSMQFGQHFPTYTLTGWEMKKATAAGGWVGYLEHTTGVRGDHWINYNVCLLIHEAQQNYWNVNGLRSFVKAITLGHPVKVILFASYRSPGGRGLCRLQWS